MKIRTKTRAIAAGLLLVSLAAPAPAEEGTSALLEENLRARYLVARITAPTTEGAGILFHIDPHYAYGITAKHVVYQRGKVVPELRAHFQAWPGKELPVEAHKLHHEKDLAVFRVDLRPLGLSRGEVVKAIPLDMLGSAARLDPGDELSSMGHSTAGAWITPKQWVRFARRDGDAFLFEYACPQGHSGGAVFDREWRLVGMMIDEERPYCRALAIDPVLKIVQAWKLGIDLHAPAAKEAVVERPREIVVAVTEFDNRSAKDLPRLGALAQDITSSFLNTVPGVTEVTRTRLDTVRGEINLPDSVQTGTGTSRLGQLLEADALVTGSVLRYDVERRVFEGYGTSALQDVFRMDVSLQVLEVATGRVLFSETYPIERMSEYTKATSAPRQPIDRTSELLSAILNGAQAEVRGALMQLTAGLKKAGQFIEVLVVSTPPGAAIVISGAYHGTTPETIHLTLDEHDVALELPGYQTWHYRVRVKPGTTIDATLIPRH